jgi:hypothetical protein
MNLRRIKRVIHDGNYIPVPPANFDTYTQFDRPYWTPALRIPLENIRVDKSRMEFPNDVSMDNVEDIVEYFDIDFWYPIVIDKESYLVDGQHRLEIARRVGLKYLDAVIQDTVLLETPCPKKRRPAWQFI